MKAIDAIEFKKILRHFHGWAFSPTLFLKMLLMVDASLHQDKAGPLLSQETMHLGQTMLDELTINISPFCSLAELVNSRQEYRDIGSYQDQVKEESYEVEEYNRLLNGTGVIPEMETLLVEKMLEMTLTEVIRKLQPRVAFCNIE